MADDPLNPTEPPDHSVESPVSPPDPMDLIKTLWKDKFGGEELSYENTDEFLDDLAGIMHSAPSYEDKQRYDQLEKLSPHVTAYLADEEYREYQRQKPEMPSGEPEPESGWSPPTISSVTQTLINSNHLQIDQKTGLYRSDDPTLIPHVQEANKIHQVRRSNAEALTTDPLAYLDKAGLSKRFETLEESIKNTVKDIVGDELKSFNAQHQIASARSQVSDLFQTNEEGELLNNSAGQPQLTMKGEFFFSAKQQAEQLLGVTEEDATPEQTLKVLAFANNHANTVPTEDQEKPSAKKKERQQKITEAARNGNNQINRLTEAGSQISAAAASGKKDDVHLEDTWDRVVNEE